MRAFIGIDLPDSIKEKLTDFQKELKGCIQAKFVEKENFHLCLKFLGEISEQDITKINANLNDLCRKYSTFTLSLNSVGVFPNNHDARVIWIGGNSSEAKQIYNALNNKRKFAGHITLARIKRITDKKFLYECLDKNKNKDFGSFEVKSIKLIKSELTKTGPVYKVLSCFNLLQ